MATVYRAERAILPHDVWQIDAKEQITTLNGQPACYLTITDEKTGGALEARVSLIAELVRFQWNKFVRNFC